MAFKITPEYSTFWWTFKLTAPGQKKPVEIDFECVRMTKDQLIEWRGRLADGRRDELVLAEVIKDWKGPEEPFNEANLATLITSYPASNMEILAQFVDAHTESRRKNS